MLVLLLAVQPIGTRASTSCLGELLFLQRRLSIGRNWQNVSSFAKR